MKFKSFWLLNSFDLISVEIKLHKFGFCLETDAFPLSPFLPFFLPPSLLSSFFPFLFLLENWSSVSFFFFFFKGSLNCFIRKSLLQEQTALNTLRILQEIKKSEQDANGICDSKHVCPEALRNQEGQGGPPPSWAHQVSTSFLQNVSKLNPSSIPSQELEDTTRSGTSYIA